MSKLPFLATVSIVVVLGIMVSGCAKQQPASSDAASQGQSTMAGQRGQEGHGAEGQTEQAGQSQYEETLAALSVDDRALAEKQKICPVSGKALGAMGTPFKVTVEGREVLLCCPGCESKIKENPAEYLAKIPQ